MNKQRLQHTSSIEINGNWFCIVCKRPKDNSFDDCECMFKFPKKGDAQ